MNLKSWDFCFARRSIARYTRTWLLFALFHANASFRVGNEHRSQSRIYLEFFCLFSCLLFVFFWFRIICSARVVDKVSNLFFALHKYWVASAKKNANATNRTSIRISPIYTFLLAKELFMSFVVKCIIFATD